MKRKHIVVDEDSDSYLKWVIRRIQESGVKNVSKGDALRFVIKMNQNVGMPDVRRARKKKKEVRIFL